jgi:hypothetical protein
MAGWLSFLRWLRFQTKWRRHSFPMDNHRLVLIMRDYEEMREQLKQNVILDEKKVRELQCKKNDKVLF